MADFDLDQAAEYMGIKRTKLEKIIKNGREIKRTKIGRKYTVKKEDIDAWAEHKKTRIVKLDKADFLKALKFAIRINYAGHTRADFGTSRQRSVTQAVENWTQGVLAELALVKFIKEKFNVRLEPEFRVFEDTIVGQDIINVIRGSISNPARKGVSVKSGKKNGMILIVPVNEVERTERVSDFYVFVRVIFSSDFILRLLKTHPDLSDVKDIIPDFDSIEAEIAGYCLRNELEKRTVPEASIKEMKYVKPSGLLKNNDADWREFVEQL
ncbi:MAG: excisionase family DNA-binding protein [Candidatus Nanoarchaeia archaeon]|nr:excisionase family DNA-binding protein [Candidatus Nanoarchaeia archaeon]